MHALYWYKTWLHSSVTKEKMLRNASNISRFTFDLWPTNCRLSQHLYVMSDDYSFENCENDPQLRCLDSGSITLRPQLYPHRS